MIAQPGGYTKAVELMTALKSHSIECREQPGGVWILTPIDAIRNVAESVCKKYGVHYHYGDTTTLQYMQAVHRHERDSETFNYKCQVCDQTKNITKSERQASDGMVLCPDAFCGGVCAPVNAG